MVMLLLFVRDLLVCFLSVGSMRYSGTWNLPAAIACAFCFQSLLAAMLAACFYVPGLLFKGMENFLKSERLPQVSRQNLTCPRLRV